MLTLKLFKIRNGQTIYEVKEVSYIRAMEIGSKNRCLEIWAFKPDDAPHYDTYYVGEKDADMDAVTDHIHFDWGYLENARGHTTQTFRPTGGHGPM